MTTQLVTLITVALPAYIALFVIAYAVLRLYRPRMVTAQAATGPLIHVSRDVVYLDKRTTPHADAIERGFVSNHYRFVERLGDVVTYRRDEYHGPAATWR